jgi:hypothetical protein
MRPLHSRRAGESLGDVADEDGDDRGEAHAAAGEERHADGDRLGDAVEQRADRDREAASRESCSLGCAPQERLRSRAPRRASAMFAAV